MREEGTRGKSLRQGCRQLMTEAGSQESGRGERNRQPGEGLVRKSAMLSFVGTHKQRMHGVTLFSPE